MGEYPRLALAEGATKDAQLYHHISLFSFADLIIFDSLFRILSQLGGLMDLTGRRQGKLTSSSK